MPHKQPGWLPVRRLGYSALLAGMAFCNADDALIGGTPNGPAVEAGFSVLTLIRGTQAGAGDQTRDVAVDADGNVYVTGGTGDPSFPTTPGAYQRAFGRGMSPTSTGSEGNWDVFVMKFAADGRLLWSTLLGGPNYERAYAIEVDASGVYLAGRAGEGFPTTGGVVQQTFAGDQGEAGIYGSQDGFVAKLSLDGGSLLFASYLGGPANEFIRDLAVDAGGNLYAALSATKQGFPHISSGAFQPTNHGQSDGAVCRLAAGASSVRWCTFIGGSGDDGMGPAIRLDGSGDVYYLQTLNSRDAPTTPGAYQAVAPGGGSDLLLSKFSPQGTLIFSTYFGGRGSDAGETHNLWVTSIGEAFFGAWTNSSDLPTTENAYQKSLGDAGGGDGFVARLSADGRSLIAGTYLGGSQEDVVEGIGMDGSGNVVVSGTTNGAGFPSMAGAPQPLLAGREDAFIAVLTPSLTSVMRSTFVGGSGLDFGRTIAVDATRRVIYTGGNTESSDFPTNASAFLKQYAGRDAFLAGWRY